MSPEAYVRGRAGYPGEAIDILADKLEITGDSTVLDLGAGTGKLPRATREEVTRETRDVLQTHLDQKGGDEVGFPYRVDIFWTTRKP